jgi:hypothetical protein
VGQRLDILLPPEYSTFYSITSSYYKPEFNNYKTEELSHSLLPKLSLYPICEHTHIHIKKEVNLPHPAEPSFDPTYVFAYGNY